MTTPADFNIILHCLDQVIRFTKMRINDLTLGTSEFTTERCAQLGFNMGQYTGICNRENGREMWKKIGEALDNVEKCQDLIIWAHNEKATWEVVKQAIDNA
jgi:hypothetical protein